MIVCAEIEPDLGRRLAVYLEGRCNRRFQRAEAGGGEIAGNTVDRGAVRTVRRQVDFDHRIVKPGIGGKAGSNRGVVRQVDNAVMAIRHPQLFFRTHHATALDATDGADGKRHVDAGNIGAGSGKGADQASARIRSAADDLDRGASTGIDHQHSQLVSLRMFFSGDDLGDHERLERGLVIDLLDLKPDRRQARADLFEGGIRFQMIFQPGECEFH